MNIRTAVIEAVIAARVGWDRKGYMHRVYVMVTSPRWSAL